MFCSKCKEFVQYFDRIHHGRSQMGSPKLKCIWRTMHLLMNSKIDCQYSNRILKMFLSKHKLNCNKTTLGLVREINYHFGVILNAFLFIHYQFVYSMKSSIPLIVIDKSYWKRNVRINQITLKPALHKFDAILDTLCQRTDQPCLIICAKIIEVKRHISKYSNC